MKRCDRLSPRGRLAQEWHALGCPECRRTRTADARLAREASLLAREAPPAELESRILARLGLEAPLPRRRPIAPLVAAAAASGGLVLAAAMWTPRPAPRPGKPVVIRPEAPKTGAELREPATGANERTGHVTPVPDRKRSGYPRRSPLKGAPEIRPRDRSPLQVASPSGRPPVYGGPVDGHSSAPLPGPDMLLLNEGALAAAAPATPPLSPPAPLLPAPLPERQPGSRVVDDLLLLNPVRVATADETGLASEIAADAAATDERLQQKVTVRATFEPLSDVLALLSRATGVTLMARMEIASEWVTLWADDRPLIDVMRDLRHTRGYYWSRSRRDGRYVYALWQDAQSRAREEEEYRREALETRRAFEENLRRHVRALGASEAELMRLAQEDPYLVAQIKHPVVRAGYELFASLSPDQQAKLTRGETPGRHRGIGDLLTVFARESYTKNGRVQVFAQAGENATRMAPDGDVVTLRWSDLSSGQRATVGALLRAAAARGTTRLEAEVLENVSRESMVVSLFRWGQPLYPGLSMRLDFEGDGRRWGLYSNIGVPADSQKMLGDWLRRGDYSWPELQETANRYLGDPKSRPEAPEAKPVEPGKPDPVLDAPISVTWELPSRGGRYKLFGGETIAALHRELGRPLVIETQPRLIEQRPGEPGVADPARFRWEKRPLRELIGWLFPECVFNRRGETLFVTRREPRLRVPYELPHGVVEFLRQLREPFSLEDLAMVARSLSPAQVAGLSEHLPSVVIDQVLALQELLKLYGELAPAQRRQLARGLSYRAMTPAQRGHYHRFAARQRPFLAAWRLEQGEVRVTTAPVETRQEDFASNEPRPVARALFTVRFQEEDAASFPLDLYAQQEKRERLSVAHLVGKPFPFPEGSASPFARNQGGNWTPVLADKRLRGKPLVLMIHWPYADPYAGTSGPPGADAWARGVAERLRETAMTVVQVAVGPAKRDAAPESDPRLPRLLRATEPGDANGQPLESSRGEGATLFRAPAVFVVDADEIVRAVFEGQDAWDTAAIERAARAALGEEETK